MLVSCLYRFFCCKHAVADLVNLCQLHAQDCDDEEKLFNHPLGSYFEQINYVSYDEVSRVGTDLTCCFGQNNTNFLFSKPVRQGLNSCV